jgi:hypothetical protein
MRGGSCFGQVQSMDVALEGVRKWGGFSSRERKTHDRYQYTYLLIYDYNIIQKKNTLYKPLVIAYRV